MKKANFLLNIAVIVFTANLSAQPGSLYTGFDTDGIVTTAVGIEDVIMSVAVQPDDKIVVAGYASNGSNDDIAVARYLPDGTLDTSFSGDGKLVTDIDTSNEQAYAVALQTDGKIVVAGYHCHITDYDFVLVRYNSDGSYDNTFNSNGIVTTNFGTPGDHAFSIGIQTDGKIVAAGRSFNGVNYDFTLARYNTDGSLDNTFGNAGKVITDFSSSDDMVYSMRILPDGRILATGRSYNGSYAEFALASYTQVGTLASSFGTGGKVTTDFGPGHDYVNSVFDLPNGAIMVAGSSENGADRDFILARYDDDGDLDTSFNKVGYVTTAIGSNHDDAHSVWPQPDGSLVVSGCYWNDTDWDFALCRYTTEGKLDNTFGSNGIVTTNVSTYDDAIFSSIIVPGGNIIVAGYSRNATDADFALAEYYLWTPTSIINLSGSSNQVWIYPNPVEQEVTLEYSLDTEEEISVCLLDIQGRILETYIDNEKQSIGKHELTFSLPEVLPFGNYLFRLSSPKGIACIKIFK